MVIGNVGDLKPWEPDQNVVAFWSANYYDL